MGGSCNDSQLGQNPLCKRTATGRGSGRHPALSAGRAEREQSAAVRRVLKRIVQIKKRGAGQKPAPFFFLRSVAGPLPSLHLPSGISSFAPKHSALSFLESTTIYSVGAYGPVPGVELNAPRISVQPPAMAFVQVVSDHSGRCRHHRHQHIRSRK